MPRLEAWTARLQADLDEVEEVEREWEKLRRLDEEIGWLVERCRADRSPPPWPILEALAVRVELGRLFLRVRSWDALYQWAADEPDCRPRRELGASYWADLADLEDAVVWLETRLDQGHDEGRALMPGLLDRLIDLWEQRANDAIEIAMEDREG